MIENNGGGASGFADLALAPELRHALSGLGHVTTAAAGRLIHRGGQSPVTCRAAATAPTPSADAVWQPSPRRIRRGAAPLGALAGYGSAGCGTRASSRRDFPRSLKRARNIVLCERAGVTNT